MARSQYGKATLVSRSTPFFINHVFSSQRKERMAYESWRTERKLAAEALTKAMVSSLSTYSWALHDRQVHQRDEVEPGPWFRKTRITPRQTATDQHLSDGRYTKAASARQ